MVEGDGTSSGIVQRDEAYRNTTETTYKFDLALGTNAKLPEKLPAVDYETTEGEGSEAQGAQGTLREEGPGCGGAKVRKSGNSRCRYDGSGTDGDTKRQ